MAKQQLLSTTKIMRELKEQQQNRECDKDNK
jgi:hypothetical protein